MRQRRFAGKHVPPVLYLQGHRVGGAPAHVREFDASTGGRLASSKVVWRPLAAPLQYPLAGPMPVSPPSAGVSPSPRRPSKTLAAPTAVPRAATMQYPCMQYLCFTASSRASVSSPPQRVRWGSVDQNSDHLRVSRQAGRHTRLEEGCTARECGSVDQNGDRLHGSRQAERHTRLEEGCAARECGSVDQNSDRLRGSRQAGRQAGSHDGPDGQAALEGRQAAAGDVWHPAAGPSAHVPSAPADRLLSLSTGGTGFEGVVNRDQPKAAPTFAMAAVAAKPRGPADCALLPLLPRRPRVVSHAVHPFVVVLQARD